MRIFGTLCVCALVLAGEASGWARSSVDGYAWRGRVGQTLKLRNLNGPVVVEAAAGNEAEVTAVVSYDRSNPKEIRFEQRGDDRVVTICAAWQGQGSCLDGGRGETRNNDLSVEFHVKLPRGAAIDAATVNGGLTIHGVEGATRIATVNGSIEVDAAAASLRAETVNGSIEVRLPREPDADIAASTVNGRIEILGTKYRGSARTTLGRGGRTLSAETVNGSIAFR